MRLSEQYRPRQWSEVVGQSKALETLERLRKLEVCEAARHLAKSDKGRDALRKVVDWLENSGLSLDYVNQDAILTLLDGAWNGYAGTVRNAMHEALGD